MPNKDGGPAFPRTGNYDQTQPADFDSVPQDGMTLRDYFANEAQSVCPISQYEHQRFARWCYERADAMLEARTHTLKTSDTSETSQ